MQGAKKAMRFSSLSRHHIAPIMIRSSFRACFRLTGDSKRNLINTKLVLLAGGS